MFQIPYTKLAHLMEAWQTKFGIAAPSGPG